MACTTMHEQRSSITLVCAALACAAGIDTLGVAFAQQPHTSAAEYKWAAEGCSIARRAHHAFWSALGSEPVLWHRAEDPRLADEAHHADIEFLTLRYA